MSIATDTKLAILTQLTEGDFEAFLYDCDGTLADNMKAHKDAYVRVAARHGLTLDPSIVDEFAGLPTVLVVAEINKRYGTSFDTVAFATEKSAVFYDEFVDHTLPIEFVVQHLKNHKTKVKIGVVSGGSRRTVQKTLQVLGLTEWIDTLVCAGETENGKPWPDPFLKAAADLGVDPAKCMVFEDGDAGTKAADAAGMKWIRIDKI